MSDSARMRETICNNKIASSKSKKTEKKLAIVSKHVLGDLQDEFPEEKIEIQSQLGNKELIEATKKFFEQTIYVEANGEPLKAMTNNLRSSIRPDGGIITIEIEGKKHVVLVAENKIQGTNKKRKQEGEIKQAMGNAIERLAKNVKEIELFTALEEITPYVTFASGCDLYEGSPIQERVRSLTCRTGFNKIYLYDALSCNGERPLKRATIFMREEEWSYEEIYDVLYEMASGAVEYYLKKYSNLDGDKNEVV